MLLFHFCKLRSILLNLCSVLSDTLPINFVLSIRLLQLDNNLVHPVHFLPKQLVLFTEIRLQVNQVGRRTIQVVWVDLLLHIVDVVVFVAWVHDHGGVDFLGRLLFVVPTHFLTSVIYRNQLLIQLAFTRLLFIFLVKDLLRQINLAVVNILKFIDLGIVLIAANHHTLLCVLDNMGVVAFCFENFATDRH